MSIRDIRAILTRTPASASWLTTVDEQIAVIDAQIAELTAARSYLGHLRGCQHPGTPDCCPDFRARVELPEPPTPPRTSTDSPSSE